MLGPEGQVVGCVGVAHDVSDRKRAEEARIRAREADARARIAEESANARARFLSSMSHELRTPLNAILCNGAGYLIMDGAAKVIASGAAKVERV